MEFSKATDFNLTSLKIEGKEILPMFFSISVYENVMSSVLSGEMVLVETTSNQFLADYEIEGNEKISFSISLPGDEALEFEGFINRIAARTKTPNGQSTYTVEFTSGTVRENESKFITKRYSASSPDEIVKDSIKVLNRDAELPVKIDKFVGRGLPMNFVASRWHPIRNIQYVQSHGVPVLRGGSTSINTASEEKEGRGKGTGAFLFFETLNGYRFGSSVEFLAGNVGVTTSGKFEYRVADLGDSMEQKRGSILDYENIQNNDTQTQMRAGAFKSKLIAFDMDTGQYREQEWESQMMTEKQKKLSKSVTRYMNKPMSNQRYENDCSVAPPNTKDQTLKYLQQQQGTINNILDGVCQYTLPIRTDVNVGDKIDILLYETGIDSGQKSDKKYSGKWIVSSVAHHFLLEKLAAYTRVSCIRATNQTDESSAMKVSLVNN